MDGLPSNSSNHMWYTTLYYDNKWNSTVVIQQLELEGVE